jgi:osomolarity two-component system phosphorelay intermediate protein YPD1
MLDFDLISTLSHFFKGSSAALGVLKVSTTCGEIHLCSSLEHLKTSSQRASGKGPLQLGVLLRNVAVEYLEAADWLKGHYQRKDDIASTAKDNLRDLISLGKSGLFLRVGLGRIPWI